MMGEPVFKHQRSRMNLNDVKSVGDNYRASELGEEVSFDQN
jgi:hypothetical protein